MKATKLREKVKRLARRRPSRELGSSTKRRTKDGGINSSATTQFKTSSVSYHSDEKSHQSHNSVESKYGTSAAEPDPNLLITSPQSSARSEKSGYNPLSYELNPLTRFVDQELYTKGSHPLRKNSFVTVSKQRRKEDKARWAARNVVRKFAPIPALRKLSIIRVGTGLNHSLFLTDENQVLALGSNSFGQLGVGDRTSRLQPTPVDLFHKNEHLFSPVVQLVGGMRFSAVLCASGHLFTFGTSTYGELGHGLERESCLQPRKVSMFLNDEEVNASSGKVAPSELWQISDVAAGAFHVLAKARDGTLVFSWGRGYSGQLGLGDRVNQFTPRPIRTLRSLEPVVQINAGYSHSCIITESGDVWTWGSGKRGELGYEAPQDQLIPKVVESLSCDNATSIAAGGQHTVVLVMNDDDPQLLPFHGQRVLVLGAQGTQQPHRIAEVDLTEFSSLGKVVQVDAGGGKLSVVFKNGFVGIIECSDTVVQLEDRTGLEFQRTKPRIARDRSPLRNHRKKSPKPAHQKGNRLALEDHITETSVNPIQLLRKVNEASQTKIITNSNVIGRKQQDDFEKEISPPVIALSNCHTQSKRSLKKKQKSNGNCLKHKLARHKYATRTLDMKIISEPWDEIWAFDGIVDELIGFSTNKLERLLRTNQLRRQQQDIFNDRGIQETNIPITKTHFDTKGKQVGEQYLEYVRSDAPNKIAQDLYHLLQSWQDIAEHGENGVENAKVMEWKAINKNQVGNTLMGDVVHNICQTGNRLKTENVVLDIRRIFRIIDDDGSGEIDSFEMQQALQECGQVATVKTVKRVMTVYDTDGNGTISEDEFMEYALRRQLKRAKNPVADAIFKILLPKRPAVKFDEGFRMFVDVFKQECTRIGIRTLPEPLRAKLTLQRLNKGIPKGTLDLSHCELDDQTMGPLAFALMTIPVVKSLNLCQNFITTKGAKHLERAILHQYETSEYRNCAICVKCDELIEFEDPRRLPVISCPCAPQSRGGPSYLMPAYWLETVKIVDPIGIPKRLGQAKVDLRFELMDGLEYWIECTEKGVPVPGSNQRREEKPFTINDVVDMFDELVDTGIDRFNADCSGELSQEAKRRMALGAFGEVDRTGEGTLSIKKAQYALKRLGFKVKRKQFMKLCIELAEVPPNATTIDQEDFVDVAVYQLDHKRGATKVFESVARKARHAFHQQKLQEEKEEREQELREFAEGVMPLLRERYYNKAHSDLRKFTSRLKRNLYDNIRKAFHTQRPFTDELTTELVQRMTDISLAQFETFEWTTQPDVMSAMKGVIARLGQALTRYYVELARQTRVVGTSHGERHCLLLCESGAAWLRGFQSSGNGNLSEQYAKRFFEGVLGIDFIVESGGKARTVHHLARTQAIPREAVSHDILPVERENNNEEDRTESGISFLPHLR